MAQRGSRFRPLEFFLLLASLLLFAAHVGYADYVFPNAPLWERAARGMVLPLAAGAFLLLLFRPGLKVSARISRSFSALPEIRKYILLLLVFGIPRALLWLLFPSRIASDYALYVTLGENYMASGSFPASDFLLEIAPNVTLYSAVLGLVMRVFGAGTATAQWFCMVLNACNVLLLFAAAKRLTTPARAFLAALLFALVPENIFYSVLPGIESLSLFTILLGLLLVFSVPGKKPAVQALLLLCGGLLLALSACIRASAWAAVVAAAAWLLMRLRLPLKKTLVLLAAFAVGLAGAKLWHTAFQNRVFPDEKPVSGIGWPLFEGLDITGGDWTPEKAARRDEVIAASSPAESDRIFREEGLARFGSYSLSEKIRMFARKGGIVWFDSGYSVYLMENTAAMAALGMVVKYSLLVLYGLWIACMLARIIRLASGADRAACALCLVFILLTALWHEFGTSIGRYRYMMLPFIALMTAVCLPVRTGRKRRDE